MKVFDGETLPVQLVFDNANDVLQLLLTASDDAHVDLSSVEYCDSAGMAALVRAKSIRKKAGKSISYQTPQKQLVDLAKFMKVDDLLFS